MKGDVSLDEAVAVLRRMIAEPEMIRTVQVVDETTFGPVPFFFDDAEVTLAFGGGVIEDVVSVRIDRRFSNDRAWPEPPLEALTDVEFELLQVALHSDA